MEVLFWGEAEGFFKGVAKGAATGATESFEIADTHRIAGAIIDHFESFFESAVPGFCEGPCHSVRVTCLNVLEKAIDEMFFKISLERRVFDQLGFIFDGAGEPCGQRAEGEISFSGALDDIVVREEFFD